MPCGGGGGRLDRLAASIFPQTPGAEYPELERWTRELSAGNGDDIFRVHGPGETLVWNGVDFDNFLEPMPVFPPEMEADLTRVVRMTVERGWPFRYHASYDQSIERFLGVMETINQDLPVGNVRWILDHAETISARNVDRVAALGGVIAVQHQMAFQGDIFREHYGDQVARRSPPVGEMLRAGVHVGMGTDTTRVASYNPWVGLWWLITGKTLAGTKMRAAENNVDRLTALRLYTQGSAWMESKEQDKGTLMAGQLADLAVLSDDYLKVPVDRIKEIESVLTVMDGKTPSATSPPHHCPSVPTGHLSAPSADTPAPAAPDTSADSSGQSASLAREEDPAIDTRTAGEPEALRCRPGILGRTVHDVHSRSDIQVRAACRVLGEVAPPRRLEGEGFQLVHPVAQFVLSGLRRWQATHMVPQVPDERHPVGHLPVVFVPAEAVAKGQIPGEPLADRVALLVGACDQLLLRRGRTPTNGKQHDHGTSHGEVSRLCHATHGTTGNRERSRPRRCHNVATCLVLADMSQSLESSTGVDTPVTVIKNYTVPADEAEYFVEVYRENAWIMSAQPGFVRSRLHRALADAPEVRFVHIADWNSGTALDKATANPEWLASLRQMFDDPGLHITSEPAAYRVAVELHPS
ncbi:amidohydrolase family protein [Kibdelosporangium philippinense]|uniref:Amidohydrolase family protein n=1 Tax=Kibdelosporangium philippinense TaxID=211113 RepID=A0ABS8ZBT9_9PSEU|nr:amidohydrolase family protein [Kibdelosporangium philippinense]MCE7004300.1 amidohydrolase family protein [Kibdelosporangium philippinense]